MRFDTYKLRSVNEVSGKFAGSAEILRGENISASGRYSLANAAAAAGTNADELAARMEYRLRRNAQRATTANRTESEGELVA